MATKAEKEDALAVERTKAALDGRHGIPNPTGETLIFDPRAPGLWRKATAEEAHEHDMALDEALIASRADQAKHPDAGDNP